MATGVLIEEDILILFDESVVDSLSPRGRWNNGNPAVLPRGSSFATIFLPVILKILGGGIPVLQVKQVEMIS